MAAFGPVELAFDGANALGEGPVWSVAGQCLWWLDIRAPAIFRLDPVSSNCDRFDMPTIVGAVALRSDGDLLVALRGSLQVFSPKNGEFRVLTELEKDLLDNRPNEGRCDPAGRFWLGTMVDLAPYAGGALYRFGKDGSPASVLQLVHIPNSLCWSPDERTMYFADSPSGEIRAYDYDIARGTLSNERVHVRSDAAPGKPDGSTVDSDGCLWNARYGAGCVARFKPDGNLDLIVDMPVSQVTACAFGGSDLKTLFVTSARQRMSQEALDKEPLAGGLFAVQTPYRGRPEPFVKL